MRAFAGFVFAICCTATAAMATAPAAPLAGAAPPDYLTLVQLQQRYALPRSRFVTIRGLRLHYVDEGRGPVIVLIHGSNGSLRTYDRVAARLRARYRIIRFDQANMGLSGPAPPTMLAEPLYPVSVLADLLDRLNAPHATLVGVSGGGALAFYFAAGHPDRVDRLILSNAPIGRADGAGMALSKDLAHEMGGAKGRLSGVYRSPAFWRAFFTFFTGEPERIGPAILTQYYDMNRRVPAPDRLAIVEALDDAALTHAALASITAPTLLIWGARDPILPPSAAKSLEAALTSAQVSTLLLPDVGHFPPLEAPDRFAAIVADFIEAATPVRPRAPAPADR